jgi:hypothetical protein
VFVRLDDPRGQHYGGLVAAPVFKKAIQTTLLAERMPVDSSFIARIRQPGQVVRLASASDPAGAEVAYAPAPDPLSQFAADPVATAGAAAASAAPGPDRGAGTGAGTVRDGVSAAAPAPGGGSPTSDYGSAQEAVPPPGEVRVPDFTAMSLREALVVATQRRLELRFTGAGAVSAQDPPAGEIVPFGSTVRVQNGGR